MPKQRHLLAAVLLIPVLFARAAPATALDQVTLKRDDTTIHIDGKLLLRAQDEGLLLLARDGVLWAVPPEQQIEQTSDQVPFRPFTPDEMEKRLLGELPSGFKCHRTAHYLIFHDTSEKYARWCGSLFERLYMAFTNYWRRKGFDLSEPQFPLVAVVFAERDSYMKFARPELGDAGGSIIGYFSLRTNRMTMYDLTGLESFRRFRGRLGSGAQISRILAQPEALRTVSTIVHEATHQIAFNCGLHTRYSDCPVWFSEGIAVYFETPDLKSSKGWRGIGVINRTRLARFHAYLRWRPPNSLRTLIADDKRFRDTRQMPDAYAETWALTYYLIRQRSEQYIAYLRMLSQKGPLLNDDPGTRLKEFEQAFGEVDRLDAEFVRYMRRTH